MERAEVLILGAGAAGLAAARRLSRAARRAVIVEARDRIGGRIWTIRDRGLPAPVELGAEFIHGRPEATWSLIREAGSTAYDLPYEHWQRRRRRLVHLDSFSGELDKVMGGLSRLRGRDVSFAQYLRTHARSPRLAEARRMALAFVEGFDAADPERISARSIAEEQEGLGDVGEQMQFRLLGGYGALVEHLRRSLDSRRVRLVTGATVREVHWSRGEVEVVCGPAAESGGVRSAGRTRVRERRIRASRAIITLPVGVLQLAADAPGSVRFAPEVPDIRRAAGRLGSGAVIKVVVRFREAFWESEAVARAAGADRNLRDATFMHDPDLPLPTWWTMRPLRLPVLTGWAGGPRALGLSGLSREALNSTVVESLSGLLGQRPARVRSLIERVHTHDWPADPLARGAYSYITVGAAKARADLARPVEGTLFFAGEACDTSGQASTVAGALASGEAAAEKALKAM